MMRASIIIVTYGQRELTEQCLRSLERCHGSRLGADWELVLVDNASPDSTPELMRQWSDRAIVRLLDENRNFAGGCNVGAAEAHGDVLVFLNNDTEVTPGALETVVEQALEPGVSVAGCRLLFPHGTLQHAGVAFLDSSVFENAVIAQHVFYHQDQDLFAARASYELDCVTGACMAVRATTFRAVGGFDEGYLNGLEDVDLCLRIRLTGERIVYRGDATIVHYEGASRGSGRELTATPEREAAVRHNIHRFVATWNTQLSQDDALAVELWDAALEAGQPPRLVRTADVVVQGQPSGIGDAADEARALLMAFSAHGRITAAADSPPPSVIARLSGETARVLQEARRRNPVPGAPWVIVPTGAHDPHEVDLSTIVRLARPETAVALADAAAVWASSPRVADALIHNGLPAHRVSVVPPVVPRSVPGPGGGGVLAVLPVHDNRRARAVIDAVRRLPTSVHVRLVPTVFSRHLDRDVAETLPGAELLGPCSDEMRFAEIASTADVVVAVDVDDRYERRALVAASVGAAPITANPGGPAAAVLGDEVVGSVDALGSKLTELLIEPGDRTARARQVQQACSSEALATYWQSGFAAAA